VSLARLAGVLGAAGQRVRRRGLDYARLTIPQRAFLSETARIALWRDGNQLGKSYALALETIARARGIHPIHGKVRRSKRSFLLGYSWEQMEPLQDKLWQLLPKDEIDPGHEYDPGRGIRGKPPRIAFVRGPGAGSVINLATYKQGAKRLAGPTVGFVGMDEPPEGGLFGEVVPRVLKERGIVRITFTPVPDMPDMTWLRDKVKARQIAEHNFGLQAKYCQPEGYPAPWLFQHEIDEYEGLLLEVERGMRMRGDWDPVYLGAWLRAFSAEAVLLGRPPTGAYLIVGIDHGAQSGKQTAVLVAVQGRHTDRPRVWVIDEHVSEGITTPEQDAKAVLAMLERRGYQYDHVDAWVGDRPTRSKRFEVNKNNKDMREELARELRRDLANVKKIDDVYKWPQSLSDTMRLLNTCLVRHHMIVHPRCEQFIKACKQFDGNPHHKLKDVLDAGRYAAQTAILGRKRPTKQLIARY